MKIDNYHNGNNDIKRISTDQDSIGGYDNVGDELLIEHTWDNIGCIVENGAETIFYDTFSSSDLLIHQELKVRKLTK